MRSYTTTVDLTAILHDGRSAAETVLVERIGDDRFRLLSSPGLVLGLAAGDEFELAPGEPQGYRLLRRGGNVCVQVFLSKNAEECRQTLISLVEELSGRLDGEAKGKTTYELVFTIPVTAGFPAIERVMKVAETMSPGCEWFYGNVYDTKDGTTPLNWWLESGS
jgi:hypothetical protein